MNTVNAENLINKEKILFDEPKAFSFDASKLKANGQFIKSKAKFFIQTNVADSISSSHDFSNLTPIQLTGRIRVAPDDVGKKAEIIVVASYNGVFYIKSELGWQKWDGRIDHLVAIKKPQALQGIEDINIVSDLAILGSFKIYLGYRLNGALHHSKHGLGFRIYKGKTVKLGKLNDTGITWGTDYPNRKNNTHCIGTIIQQQDCSQGLDAQAAAGTLTKIGGGRAGFDFTKLDGNGQPLDAKASNWSCVKDNHTGLIWEIKTDNGSIHDKDNTYRWGGVTALGSGTKGRYYSDWDILVNGSNAESLCGFSNWRVPTSAELGSLVDFSRKDIAIDTDYFSYALPGVWSSEPYAVDSANLAWIVGFKSGNTGHTQRLKMLQVLLVHSQQ
ncbi:MAG: DUF1566 domain-containing protein [Methylococcales bacterium]|nr:DUF1566 domain-containing protein [Methylococcales bacterium]